MYLYCYKWNSSKIHSSKPLGDPWRLPKKLRTHTLLIRIKTDTKNGAVEVVTDRTGNETEPEGLTLSISDAVHANGTSAPKETASAPISLVQDPPKRKAAEIPPEECEAASEGAGQLYERIQDLLVGLLREIAAKKKLRLNSLLQPIEQMAGREENLEALYSLSLQNRDYDNALSAHLLHVATYALKIGKALGCDSEQLKRLALAGLLHDVGMCLTPKEIRHKEAPLTSREMEIIRRHTEYGSRIIQAHLGDKFGWLTRVISQEHERANGNGYPKGLYGDEIDEMAMIIAVSDVYEALTSQRPYRPPLRPNKAMNDIMVKQKGGFPHRILKVLLYQFPHYPLHSLVRLNTNEIARVVEIDEEKPLRPTVSILHGLNGNGHHTRDNGLLPLMDNPLIYIVDSVDQDRLAKAE